MTKLTDLGFSKDTVVETILSTYNPDGQPNAAPMGILMKNEQCVTIKLYKSSSTYQNLVSRRCGVINITSDPELFFLSAFKEANPNAKIPPEWFEKAEILDAPKLHMADATVEISVAKITPINAEKTEAVCDVKLVKATKALPKVYCRALFATIEAIIHATRIKVFLSGNNRQREQASILMENIAYCKETVNRVAPNSNYAEILTELTKMITTWRIESESIH
jgi:hypothetical protein